MQTYIYIYFELEFKNLWSINAGKISFIIPSYATALLSLLSYSGNIYMLDLITLSSGFVSFLIS